MSEFRELWPEVVRQYRKYGARRALAKLEVIMVKTGVKTIPKEVRKMRRLWKNEIKKRMNIP